MVETMINKRRVFGSKLFEQSIFGHSSIDSKSLIRTDWLVEERSPALHAEMPIQFLKPSTRVQFNSFYAFYYFIYLLGILLHESCISCEGTESDVIEGFFKAQNVHCFLLSQRFQSVKHIL
jgi:hypothetical protein